MLVAQVTQTQAATVTTVQLRFLRADKQIIISHNIHFN
jgi:hypothetical protein